MLKIKVIKRDGAIVEFDKTKVTKAIFNAVYNVMPDNSLARDIADCISESVFNSIKISCLEDKEITVEKIQDIVIEEIKNLHMYDVAEHYKAYREERTKTREKKSNIMKAIVKIGEETDKENANVGNNFSAKLLQIASTGNKWASLSTMPKEFARAHELGYIHIHDCDSYNLTVNCSQVGTRKVLESGFNTGYGTLNEPKTIEVAAELSCILLQSVQNDQFGGVSHVNFDNDLSKYVGLTREKIRKDLMDFYSSMTEDNNFDTDKFNIEVEKRLRVSVSQAMQAFTHNCNSLHARAGSQVPFSSVNIGIPENEDAALLCEIFLKEYNKGMGKQEQMIFPNITFRIKKGINFYPNDPYRYLTDLAIKVSARRMNPTFRLIDNPLDLPYFERGILPAQMGCRTNVMSNINGEDGPEGRGNIAPVSINLVRLGIEAKGNWDKFFSSLEKIMDLCDRQLSHRYDILKKLKCKDLPFLAGQKIIKGSENLDDNDSIEPILKQGTWGIGFIGVAETLIAMMGVHHGESEEALKKAHDIIDFMEKKVNEYQDKRQLNYSLYATPAEGLSGRFTAIDLAKYGYIENVTSNGFYTNSFHVPVYHNISAVSKANIEAPFHKQCTGGMISYFEIDGGDIDTRAAYIDRHLKHCVENTDIIYVAYNFRIKYCKDCGENMLIEMQKCPKCGSRRTQGISRVTGYMSLDERFGPGKLAEREARIIHK